MPRGGVGGIGIRLGPKLVVDVERVDLVSTVDSAQGLGVSAQFQDLDGVDLQRLGLARQEIGRASCRERV